MEFLTSRTISTKKFVIAPCPRKKSIFPHGQVDEMDPCVGKHFGRGHDFGRRFAIALQHLVLMPVLTESAVVSAKG